MEYLKNKLFHIKNFWVGLFFMVCFFHFNHILDGDEGIILEGAWNLLNNKKLYLDFFEFVPPGSFYLIFWSFKIFGPYYFIAKFISIIFLFFTGAGIFKISQIIFKEKFFYAYLSVLIFFISSIFWPLINHNTLNLFFIVWALYFFTSGLNYNKTNYYLLSGLLTGLSVLFLQQKGIILFLTLIFFLVFFTIKEKNAAQIKNLFYFSLFTFLPLILFLNWPIKIIYQNFIIFPLFNYTETNKMPYELLLTYLLFLFLSTIIIKEKSKKIWLLILVQFSLLLSTIPRPDLYHISLVSFPFIILLVLIFKEIKISDRKNFLFYSPIFLTFIFITVFPAIIYLYNFPPFYSVTKNKMFNFIKENCQDSPYLYAGPFMPGIYFETKKLNATPFPFLITGQQTKKQFLKAKEALIKNRPRCAILNYKIIEKFKYSKDNPVDNYILNNYNLVKEEGNYYIYQY